MSTTKPLNANFDLGGLALIPRFTDAIAATVTAGTVTCDITGGKVTTTTITAPGAGYAYAPTLTANSGAATFTCTTDPITGAITSVTITAQGSAYGAAPTIAVSGGYYVSPTAASQTEKLLVPQSAVYFYCKNRTGSSGVVTITTIKDTTASSGSFVLAAGEEVILPCAGMGYIVKDSGGNQSGDFPQYIQVVSGSSTNADWFFACMTPDGQ